MTDVLSHRSIRAHALAGLALSLSFLGTPVRAQDACTVCHSSLEFLSGIVPDSSRAALLYVDPAVFRSSVHGGMGFTCAMCHPTVGDYPHGEVPRVQCGMCHPGAQRQLAASVHGRPYAETGEVPATCADCHTDHHILGPANPESSVYRLTQFEGCANCHSDAEHMGRFGQDNVETVQSYMNSVHGRGLLAKGLTVAPVCTDCHGSNGYGAHQIQPVADSAGSMNRAHVVETCGTCHAGIMAQYDRGIHGEMFLAGNPDVPTCTDCHREHGVAPVASLESTVNPTHVAQTCTACHDREDLNTRYGLAPARGSTFSDSFHGAALESGQVTVANCESCHGAHDILPSSDPRSMIHPENLVETCGHCHPGIGEGVMEGRIHVASVVEDVGFVGFLVQAFYILVIAGFVLYSVVLIALDQYRHRVVDPRRGGRTHG
jgi:hypothetical protein